MGDKWVFRECGSDGADRKSKSKTQCCVNGRRMEYFWAGDGDQSIAPIFNKRCSSPHKMSLFARNASRHDCRSSQLAFGTFLTAFTPYDALSTTSSFDHGSQVPTT